jgi:hypothetical protein
LLLVLVLASSQLEEELEWVRGWALEWASSRPERVRALA